MSDYSELKKLAEETEGWDNLNAFRQVSENDPDWQVGAVDEEKYFYPVMMIDTAQYDPLHDGAKKLAQYYAAANPISVLALIAEVDALRLDAERYRWLRANEFDIGSYHPEGDHNHESWFEHFDDESIDRGIADEAGFAAEPMSAEGKQ